MCAKTGKRLVRRVEPWRYTGTVLGIKEYQEKRKAWLGGVFKIARESLRTKTGRKSVWYNYNGENPYEERFGDGWEAKLPKEFDSKWASIADLHEHVKQELPGLFGGTTAQARKRWSIWHDRLPQWWSKESQDNLKRLGLHDKQWRAEGNTNDKVSPYYKNKLFGDSFVCMPLDNQIFNYMIEAEGRHVVATWALPRRHKDKFCMATPDEVWSCMERIFMDPGAIPDEWIIRDIDRLELVFKKLVEHNGVEIPSLDLRSDHRKAASSAYCGGKLMAGAKEALATMMKSWEGMSGGRVESE